MAEVGAVAGQKTSDVAVKDQVKPEETGKAAGGQDVKKDADKSKCTAGKVAGIVATLFLGLVAAGLLFFGIAAYAAPALVVAAGTAVGSAAFGAAVVAYGYIPLIVGAVALLGAAILLGVQLCGSKKDEIDPQATTNGKQSEAQTGAAAEGGQVTAGSPTTDQQVAVNQ